MGIFRTRARDYDRRPVEEGVALFLKRSAYDKFGPSILDIGDLSQPSVSTESLAAIFDLEGFTTFCNQADPHLAVPEFLGRFVAWLFERVKYYCTHSELEDGVALWAKLPYYAKFTGDGVLFLWNVEGLHHDYILNLPLHAANICGEYRAQFYPEVKREISTAPPLLRVGVARGRVLSVGDGRDFVGPCINLAARLQKLAPGLTFACSRRGLDMSGSPSHEFNKGVVLKKLAVRGIGDDERVLLLKNELKSLLPKYQALFVEP